MAVSRFISVCLVLLATGCTGPRFPIGIYDVPEEDLSVVREAGFSHVETMRLTGSYLDYADRLGLKVLPAPLNPIHRIPEGVAKFDAHRALWAWYLFDEPDLKDRTAEEMAERNAAHKGAGARKPTLLVLMNSWKLAEFSPHADWLMFDHYPVPWAPVARFQAEMAALRAAHHQKVFGVLQAFDWAQMTRGNVETTNHFRVPTAAELKVMAFMACAERVDGLFFYTFKTPKWDVREHGFWPVVVEVVAELRRKEALFQAEHRPVNAKVAYERGVALNEMGNPALTVRRLRVGRGQGEIERGEYLLCLNTTSGALAVTVELPKGERLAAVGSSGEGAGEQKFEPFEVKIFRVSKK